MVRVKDAIDRITEIASTYVSKNVSGRERENLRNEILSRLRDLSEEYDVKKIEWLKKSELVGESYFNQKLFGLRSFALMAIGVEDRLGYSDERIIENVRHFAYLVGGMTNK